MWVAKFKVWHETCKLRPLCMKYNVTDFVYVIKSWTEKKRFYYTQHHILQGKEKDQARFIKALRKEKGIKKVGAKGNCVITLREEQIAESFEPLFNPKIIQVKPVVQRTDGFEDWELASWDKKELMQVFRIQIYKVKLLSIEKKKVADIVLTRIFPDMTPKQKDALRLAIKHGYYNFPRKIDLVHLAEIEKVSRPAFQERLRKAEKKVMPMFTEECEE